MARPDVPSSVALPRRDLIRFAAALALVGQAPALAACTGSGSGGSGGGSAGGGAVGAAGSGSGGTLAVSQVARMKPATTAVAPASKAVTGFTERMIAAVLAKESGNLIASPYSVAAALAMAAAGAKGRTAQEMLTVLGGLSGADLDAGLAALSDTFAGRSGARTRGDGTGGQVVVDIANSLWAQRDTDWVQAFLDDLARWFGAGVNLVDYRSAPEPARARINAWTAAATHDKITDLVPPGAVDADTRMVLVNAVYLKAPWEEPFEPTATQPGRFTLDSGATVQARFMNNSVDGGYAAKGPGYVAVTLPYLGRELAMTLVLTDKSDPQSHAAWLTGGGLATALAAAQPTRGINLSMPSWTFRSSLELQQILSRLGMPTAFTDSADFTGMSTTTRLAISSVLHQGFVAVDEQGTEAAAATAVVMRVTAALDEPLTVVLDRPFLFVVHDIETKTPLFAGRVADPTR